MAARHFRDALRSVQNWMSTLSIATDDGEVAELGPCWILDLPVEILQMMTEFLNLNDVISLTRTCRTFHALINQDSFWTHRIRAQFPSSIAQLYTFDLFQSADCIETVDELRPSGIVNMRDNAELDLAAIHSATHYNETAVEHRQETMYVSKEDFASQVQYFQFKQPKANLSIPLMKLVYFYLRDRKRVAAVSMDVVHRNSGHLVERADSNSYTGRIIHLQSVCWLEITGRFDRRLMPGRYEVSWRMKSPTAHLSIDGETEFIVVATHGTLLIHRISDTDFRAHVMNHGNRWFLVKIGQMVIYEPSTVHVAIRNWTDGSWKSGIAWDCIELTPAP